MQERNPRGNSQDEKERYRTCCDICHIKFGTVFLGTIEAIVCIFVLIGAVQQTMWKNQQYSQCAKNFLRDCLIFQFSHFNVTLIFDYIVIIMMAFILLSVFLLFCGILSDTSCLLLPHIIIQAIFLLFSLGYFILYAVSYFYGDLYTHSRTFMMQSLIERMWLAALLLVLAAFQTYLFSAVIRCSIYVAGIEASRRRRESAFERCSERVRLAKENGLWRTTSWGGGFQQYKGQYDENRPKKTVKPKGFHVQWNIQKNELSEEEQTTKTNAIKGQMMLTTSPSVEQTCSQQVIRRGDFAENSPSQKVHRTHSYRKGQSESPKKERILLQHTPQKASSEISQMTSCRNDGNQQTDGSTFHIRTTEGKAISKIDRRESTHMTLVNSPHKRQIEKQRDKVDEEKRTHKEQEHEQNEQPPSVGSANRRRGSASGRPSLHKHKSVDSEDIPIEQKITVQRDKNNTSQQRRRSSLGCDNSSSVNQPTARHSHQKSTSRTSERRQYETPVVKKVSITATHQ